MAAAFAAVYLIWGSTYLAIRFVIETLPPFFMAGTRFVVAGVVLYLIMRLRGAQRPSAIHWRSVALIGGLMLMGGHGAVVWAEQWIPSGLTSLLIATVPLWMALLNWITTREKLNKMTVAGLILGFAGVGLLIGDVTTMGEGHVTFIIGITVVLGALLWASGSLYSRSAKLPSPPLLATAMEMIAGGLVLLLASLVTGEWMRVRIDQISLLSAVSWVYLVTFGSLIGFTCYMYLLKATTVERVSTYAYVNPVVALFLGMTLADEPLSLQNLLAAAIILASVAIITICGTRQTTREENLDR